ncbi:hypothetical protein K1W69_05030 [Hoeflea sp. WL0058]|uniref:Uncharacterized protein n=1 Tax=Flavimaribacter sediminis TaxID=2865987 RepID=A0AAE3D021_9HYPH|nr:hypothetical protein [Flavimaribacter sediminis]MBW8636547.1 hypothetical protein [Flavimaribacter sediminis]
MRKVVLLTLMAVATSLPANAMSRYDATSHTCVKIQAILKLEGAVVLRYPSPRDYKLTLYETYASDSGQCEYGQFAKPSWVPSQDKKRCRVRVCADQASDY